MEWISIKDKLPEPGVEVILLFKTGEIFNGRRSDEGVWFVDIITIDPPAYWIPCPKIPADIA